MHRQWLYNFEEGGRIFEAEEVQDALDSGFWFDTPDKCNPKGDIIAGQEAEQKPDILTKHAIGRLNEKKRIALAKEYGADISGLVRKQQIEKILTLQAEHDGSRSD